MDEKTFGRYQKEARLFCSEDYNFGYQFGLKRFYRGEPSGANPEEMFDLGGAGSQGLRDGLSGIRPRFYCTQNEGDCSTCSLVKEGRDCSGALIEPNLGRSQA
jgi:hypothetical protein